VGGGALPATPRRHPGREQAGPNGPRHAGDHGDRLVPARPQSQTGDPVRADQIEAAQPAEDDPALLDELPYAADAFTSAPEPIKAKIYAAFDIQVLYRAPIKQATIWATITPTTPAIITALTTDPRTDHDTAYGNLTTAPIAPLSECDDACDRKMRPPTEHNHGSRQDRGCPAVSLA
jgi:hypothetical protein